MREGFYTALGTPLDEGGSFIRSSFEKHVEDQISAGAYGLLVKGSMGIQPCIKDSEFPKVAAAAVEAAKGACPILVGVMDNSVGRVLDRIESLKGLKIDGVVATTPYYFMADQDALVGFFTAIARQSTYPLYIYDLPTITKTKIALGTADKLMSVPNICGIKTADLVTARKLLNSTSDRSPFSVMYSHLDTFDVAYAYGVKMTLDGIYSITAPLAAKLCKGLESGNACQAAKVLDDIVLVRDTMIGCGLWQGFTYAMNLLGYGGRFHPDYLPPVSESSFEALRLCMGQFGLAV